MFLFELISLRLPFEGYDAVKESILEGNRPILSKREISNYPTYALDLMVLCWAQNHKDRPTASSIVSISRYKKNAIYNNFVDRFFIVFKNFISVQLNSLIYWMFSRCHMKEAQFQV